MTHDQAQLWNIAIMKAIESYPKGIGAIRALKVPMAVTVEHIGTTTKQEVTVEDCGDND